MSKEIPSGEVIEGSVAKEMKDRRFLSSLDLIGYGDIEFTIDRVERLDEMVYENGKKKKNVIYVYFKETPKPLDLNVTNTKAIASITGTIMGKGWVGKKVKIGVRKTNLAGKQVDCLRVVG